MNKTFYFPCTHNASDVIRIQREQAIYNPCRTCSLQKAVDNNITLNNEAPSEGEVIQYKNGYVQWEKINVNSGLTGPDGPAGPTGLAGPTGMAGPTGASIQIIDSTYTGNVTSTILDISSLYGIVFITPDTDASVGRIYYLPVIPPYGYTLSIRNCSSVNWIVVNTEVIEGVTGAIYGDGTGATLGINHSVNQTIDYKYLGAISIGGIVRSCWIT
jgi:hypothetical protein